jgi:hypothetical protein
MKRRILGRFCRCHQPDRAELAVRRAVDSLQIRDRRRRSEATRRLWQLKTALRYETIDRSSGEVTVEWYAHGAPLAAIADGWCFAPRSRVRLLAAGDTIATLEEPVAFELLLLGHLVASKANGSEEEPADVELLVNRL